MAKYAKSKKPLVLGLRLSRLSVKKTYFFMFPLDFADSLQRPR